MTKDSRARYASAGTTAKQPARGTAASNGDSAARRADAWLAAVVFGTSEAKIPVNIRLDAEIVRYFRAGGAGYQTRINEVLKAFVAARLKAGDTPGARPKSSGNGRKRAK